MHEFSYFIPSRVRTTASFIALGVALLTLAACSDSFIGRLVRIEDAPLPGERISVLRTENKLAADASIADEQVVLPRPRIEIDWPQEGGSAAHTMSHGLISSTPREVWSQDIGKGTRSNAVLLSGPVISNGVIYTIDTEAVVSAFDAFSGEEYWRVAVGSEDEKQGAWGGGLAVDGNRLFVSTGFAYVIALDANSSAELWRTRVSGPMRSAPAIDGDRLFLITRNNKLVALSIETGEILWEHAGQLEGAGLLGASTPAIFGDAIVAAYSSGEIFVLNVRTGSEFWSDSLASLRRLDRGSSITDIRARPVISRGRVFVVTHSGRMAAYSLATSERFWELDIGSDTQPWVTGDYVFVVTVTGEVVAIKASNGLVRWVTRIGQYENERKRRGLIRWSGPILAGDRLIVAGDNGEILSLSPYTGELLGTMNIRGGVSLAPILAGETLYFLSDSGRLIAYR